MYFQSVEFQFAYQIARFYLFGKILLKVLSNSYTILAILVYELNSPGLFCMASPNFALQTLLKPPFFASPWPRSRSDSQWSSTTCPRKPWRSSSSKRHYSSSRAGKERRLWRHTYAMTSLVSWYAGVVSLQLCHCNSRTSKSYSLITTNRIKTLFKVWFKMLWFKNKMLINMTLII